MFHHLDSALRSLLLSAMPGDTAISFDTPTRSWASQKRAEPTLNVFLHQVRDDAKARLGGWVDRRDATGRVVAREQAPRGYRSCYLVTAWAADVGQEHSLLGVAVAILAAHETIQEPHLPEPLAATGFPVTVSVADPALPCAGTDIWSALDIAPRCGLDLVVTTSIVPSVATVGTPPIRRVELGVAGTVPTPAAQSPSAAPETQVRERPERGRPGPPDTRGSSRATRTRD